jgi:hypothetical protein
MYINKLAATKRYTTPKHIIDMDIIKKVFGPYTKEAYVPAPATTFLTRLTNWKDESEVYSVGINIGYGVDVTLSDLYLIPSLNKSLKMKLKPYLRLKGDAAVEYLKDHPLVLSTMEIQELENVSRSDLLSDNISRFNKKSKTLFKDCTQAQQTAVAGLIFMFGDIEMVQPRMFTLSINGHWKALSKLMTEFKGDYKERVRELGDYLDKSIKESKVKEAA